MKDKNVISEAIVAEKQELKNWQVAVFIVTAVVMDIIALVNYVIFM